MNYKLKDVVYESANHWVLDCRDKGYEVYRTNCTHSVRCSIIGYQGEEGLRRAIAECTRRESGT